MLATYLPLRHAFKLVVADDADLAAAVRLVAQIGVSAKDVWLMPEGQDAEALAGRLAWLCEEVRARRLHFRVSGRLQVTAFGRRRAV